jgi:hypothetical protein
MEELERVQRGQASSIGLLKKFNEIENKDYKIYSPGRVNSEGSRVFSEDRKRFSHQLGSDCGHQETSAENNQPLGAGRPQDYRKSRNRQQKSKEDARGSASRSGEKKRFLAAELPRKSAESQDLSNSRDKLRPTLRAHGPVDSERPTVGLED